MITVANYLEKKDTIDWSKVPSAIKAAREDVELDFDLYEDAVDVKKLIDLYITGINESQAITSTEKLKQTIEKDFGKSDNIVFVAPQKEEVGSFNLIAYAKFKGDKKFGAMDMSEGRQVGNLMYATLIPIASKQKAINILNKSKEAGEIEEFELRIGGTNKVEYSSLKSAKSQSQSKDLYIVKDGKVLTNHGMKDYSFTDNPEFAHRFEDIDFAKRMAKNYDAKIVDGFELMKSEIENYVKSSTKASAPAKIKPIKPTIAKNFVDNFSIEFQLIRRFWNIVDDGVKDVPFRKVQLLFNAFNKAALERKIRKTNDVADLFTKCSKYITRLYNEFAAPKKSDVDVELTDKTLYEEIKKYCTNVAVNPAVSVLKRYIS
ncbi:MAG: hypothetical protein H7174_07880, partial [Flavobacterium sp.]|nr:hypothetical protein [Flavobacterium sp.]